MSNTDKRIAIWRRELIRAKVTAMRAGLTMCLLVALPLGGCAYRTPDVHVPRVLVDVPGPRDTRDVAVIDLQGPIDADTAREVRADVEKLLGATSGIVHTRVAIEESRDYARRALSEDGIAVFGLWPIAFGVAYESETIVVDVDIEAHGRWFRGHGVAKKEGGLYAHARRRALAAALDRALTQL